MIGDRRRGVWRGLVLAAVAVAGFSWFQRSAPGVEVARAHTPELWVVPGPDAPGSASPLARAVADLGQGKAATALPELTRAAAESDLARHATWYLGRAQLELKRYAEAAATARDLLAAGPEGYLEEAARWLAADAAEGAADWPGAVAALRDLTAMTYLESPARAWLRLGRAAAKAGDRGLAREAFAHVHYEFPVSAEARDAAADWDVLEPGGRRPTASSLSRDLARADRLFDAGRHADARGAFEALRPLLAGEDRALADLRIGQCEFYLKRWVPARTALRVYLDQAVAPLPEAEFYAFSTIREMGQHAEYVTRARAFIDSQPDSPIVERALNALGTHYILLNDDAKAAAVFAELYGRFPTGAFADRAAWKAGWWAYKSGDYAETIRLFEEAAAAFPRADYRPPWLYWAARAHGQLGRRAAAEAGYRRVIQFYRNSYYGRTAARELERLLAALRPAPAGPVAPARFELPPSIDGGALPRDPDLVRQLLAEGLYDAAVRELRHSQRVSGSSPAIEATMAWALNRQGQLRPAITAMRRAYPQFMAEGGEALPDELLRVIFPVDYWPLIQKYSAAHRLDPFLMTALIAQESTFQADVRSSANAWGLMQVIPATGRRVAASLGVTPFRTARLTEPETNIRIGMKYFADLLRQFGDPAAALAAYNAGEHRVSRWLAERPGVARDEFIDDIPFPETQNYVKRVLGTSEDYRLLYGHLATPTPGRSGGE